MPDTPKPRILLSGGYPKDGKLSESVASMKALLEAQGADVLLVTDHQKGALGLPRNPYQDLHGVDGIVIMGSNPDIPAHVYGEPLDPHTQLPEDQSRRNYERILIREALKHEIPLRGVCYGMQLMAVENGAKLIQHLPDHEVNGTLHSNFEGRHTPTEPITVKPGTAFYDMLAKAGLNTNGVYLPSAKGGSATVEGTMLLVNSVHHQAVDGEKLGPNVEVAAVSNLDGHTVEAIQIKGHDAWGIQSHPEFLGPDHPLAVAFSKNIVEAAQNRQAERVTGIDRMLAETHHGHGQKELKARLTEATHDLSGAVEVAAMNLQDTWAIRTAKRAEPATSAQR